MGKFKIPKLTVNAEISKLQSYRSGKETEVKKPKEKNDVLSSGEKSSQKESKLVGKKRKKFKAPSVSPALKVRKVEKKSSATDSKNDISDDPESWTYFNCMWCKSSNKKNKTYQDGIFVIQRTRYSLLNDKGKEIAKVVTKTKPWKEGDEMTIGSKDIELFSRINAQDFLSGAIFLKSKDPVSRPKPTKNTVKKFKTHSKSSLKSEVKKTISFVPAPHGCVVLNEGEKQPVWIDYFLSTILRPHQVDGIRFMYKCCIGNGDYNGLGCILADEMGLGKTLQSIALFWTLLNRSPANPYKGVCEKVVIVTNSSLVGNWRNEIKKWLGPTRCNPLVCSAKTSNTDPEETIRNFKLGFQKVLIVSYSLCTRYAEAISKCKPDMLICDEGHKLKNSSIKIYRALESLNTQRRIILTGTPLQNNLEEFYSIINFINPKVFDGDLDLFRNNFIKPIDRAREPDAKDFEKNIGLSRNAQLTEITTKFILRRTQEILQKHLPPKVESVLFIKMSPLQRKLYRHVLKSNVVVSMLSSCNNHNALSVIQNLKKLLTHPDMLLDNGQEDPDGTEIDSTVKAELSKLRSLLPEDYTIGKLSCEFSGKLFVLQEFLKKLHSTGEKIVLVSNFTTILNIISKMLDTNGWSHYRLDGSTPSNKRTDIVSAFNNPKDPVFTFLLSSKAGGTGLNLIGASRLVLFDLDWNPATDIQVMARIWRDGQKRKCFIYRFIASSTIEEKIYQRQMVKRGLSSMVADAKNNKAAFSKKFLRELFVYYPDDRCQTYQDDCCLVDLKAQDPIFYSAIDEHQDLLTYCCLSLTQDESFGELLERVDSPCPIENDENDDHDDENGENDDDDENDSLLNDSLL